MDDKLRAALAAAKSAAHNFAIVAKGPAVVALLVSKVPIKDAQIQAAKKEHGGTAVVRGKCQADGGELVFRVAKETTIAPAKLKEFVTHATNMAIKPRFEVATDAEDVEAEAAEGNEAEAVEADAGQAHQPEPGAKAAATTAKSPEPPKTASPAPSADQLTATMNKLSPLIKQAVADHPDRKADILKPVAAFQAHVKAGDLAQAKADMLQASELLKSLKPAASEKPTGPVSPSATPAENEQEGEEGENGEIDLPAALANYQAARATVLVQLERLAAAVKSSGHARADKALMEIKAVQANLTAKPDKLNTAQELEKYLETDDVVADVDGPNPYGIAVDLQQTILPAVYELTACLS